jgi:hypothetical protein
MQGHESQETPLRELIIMVTGCVIAMALALHFHDQSPAADQVGIHNQPSHDQSASAEPKASIPMETEGHSNI